MEDVPEEEEGGGWKDGLAEVFLVSEDAGRRKTSLLIRGCKDAGNGWGGGESTRSGFSTHGECWSGALSHRHLVLNQQQETSSPLK